jgi:DNA-binding MarR family transcriptional regulator
VSPIFPPRNFLDISVGSTYFAYERIAMLHYGDCIVFLLAKAYQKAHSNLKKHVASYGLTPIQVLVIEALRDEEGVSAGELGRKLTLDSATLSGVLDRLAEKEWIIKETDSSDRRSLRIHLSDKAREIAFPLSEARQQANEEIMDDLSMEERIILKRLLKDLSA